MELELGLTDARFDLHAEGVFLDIRAEPPRLFKGDGLRIQFFKLEGCPRFAILRLILWILKPK